jgi:hypothetical protein
MVGNYEADRLQIYAKPIGFAKFIFNGEFVGSLVYGFNARNRNRKLLIFNKDIFLRAVCAPPKTIDFLHNSPGTG